MNKHFDACHRPLTATSPMPWKRYPPTAGSLSVVGGAGLYVVRGWHYPHPVTADVYLTKGLNQRQQWPVVYRIAGVVLDEPASSRRFTNLELLAGWPSLEWSGPWKLPMTVTPLCWSELPSPPTSCAITHYLRTLVSHLKPTPNALPLLNVLHKEIEWLCQPTFQTGAHENNDTAYEISNGCPVQPFKENGLR